MTPLLEWAFALAMIVFGATFISLIRFLGNHSALEMNSVGGVISFIYNPLNWVKLYKLFFSITKESATLKGNYRKYLILNLAAIGSMALLLLFLVP